MKIYKIFPTQPVTLSTIGTTYVAAFGVVWIFVEPLGTFGLLPQLSQSLGVGAYVGMLIAAAIPTFLFFRWFRWNKTHHLPSLNLTVQSSADGANYSIVVSQNIQVGELLDQLIKILLRGPGRQHVQAVLRLHYPILQVLRGDVYLDVDSNQTVREARLKNNDQCQITGKLQEHFNRTLLSRNYRPNTAAAANISPSGNSPPSESSQK